MASKYAEVIKGLSRIEPEDPSAQELVNIIKDRIRAAETHTPASLVKSYTLARFGAGPEFTDDHLAQIIKRLGYEGLKALVSEASKIVTAHEQLLLDSYDSSETGWGQYGAKPNAVKLPNGATLSIQQEPTAKVEDKEAFRQWCVDNGLGNLLQLWPSTRDGLVKDRLLNGQTTPDGLSVKVRPIVKYRKPSEGE